MRRTALGGNEREGFYLISPDGTRERELLPPSEQLSPIAIVNRVKEPVMVVHGANDPRDPVTESDAFVEGVRQNVGTVEYLRFPDEGHGLRKLANRVTAYRRVAAFLERTLSQKEPTR